MSATFCACLSASHFVPRSARQYLRLEEAVPVVVEAQDGLLHHVVRPEGGIKQCPHFRRVQRRGVAKRVAECPCLQPARSHSAPLAAQKASEACQRLGAPAAQEYSTTKETLPHITVHAIAFGLLYGW